MRAWHSRTCILDSTLEFLEYQKENVLYMLKTPMNGIATFN
jgi:hypothetical protein